MPKSVTPTLPGEVIGTNLSITQDGTIVSLHFDTAASPIMSKQSKRLVATSHGFARTKGVNISVNVTPVGG
jgi:hypothetical protein